MKKLSRSTTDRMLGGVCGGIGEYFDIDPVIVRVIFVLMGMAGGGVVFYLILWLVMPADDSIETCVEGNVRKGAEEIKEQAERFAAGAKTDDRQRQLWGWLIVFIGVMFLLSNFGVLQLLRLDLFWPLLIILVGVYVIFKRK